MICTELVAGGGNMGLAPNPLMRGMAGGEYVRSANTFNQVKRL